MVNVKKFEMYEEYLDNITADPSNPNVMTDTQISALMKSMEKFGLIVPIIINQDNIIIDGHQRKVAAEKLDIKKHPVIKINTTEFDQKLLKQILNKLKGTHDADLDLEEFRKLMETDTTLQSLKDYVALTDLDISAIIDEDDIIEKFDLDASISNDTYTVNLYLTPTEKEVWDKFFEKYKYKRIENVVIQLVGDYNE